MTPDTPSLADPPAVPELAFVTATYLGAREHVPKPRLLRLGRSRRHAESHPQAAPAVSPAAELYSLNLGKLWGFLKAQPASFWLVCLYLFFEYVRPQSIYDALVGPPYTRIVIILCFVAFLIEGKAFRFDTVADALLGLFTLIVLASSFNAWKPATAYDKLPDYLSWVLIYLLIANSVNTEKRFLVFMLSFLLYSFKMSQHGTRSWAQDGFAFRDWGTTGAPGWFQNSGEFGIQMCVFVPLVVFFKSALNSRWGTLAKALFWVMIVTAIVGIVASSSRGALVGIAAVALWLVLKSRYRFRALVVTALLAAFVVLILPPEQKERLNKMGDDGTSVSRKTYWHNGREMMAEYPVLGIGYNNWADYHEANYGLRALPHNVFIQAGAELGYTGLAGFGALILATLWMNRKTRKLAKTLPDGRFLHDMGHGLDGALIGFLVAGSFVTVLYYPFFWINLALTVALYRSALHTQAVTALAARREAEAAPQPALRLAAGAG